MLPKLSCIPDVRHTASLHHLMRTGGDMLPEQLEPVPDSACGETPPTAMPTCLHTEKPYTTRIVRHEEGWCEELVEYEHTPRCLNCLSTQAKVPLATDVTNYGFFVRNVGVEDVQAFADINEVELDELVDTARGLYVRCKPSFIPATPVREQVFRKKLEDGFADAVFDECLCFWCPLVVCGPQCHAAVFEDTVPNGQKLLHATCFVYGMMNGGSTISNRSDNVYGLSSIHRLAPPSHVSGLLFRGQLCTGSPCVPLYTNLLSRHPPIASMETKETDKAAEGGAPMYAKYNSQPAAQKSARRRVMSISEVVNE